MTLMLVGACAAAFGATTTVWASGPSPTPLSTLPVVVAPTPPPAQAGPGTGRTVAPTPLVLPVAPPAPRPAPVAPAPPGGVQGIQAPTPFLAPPVAALPTQPAGSGSSVVPLGLLAAFVATLLIATGLTARRRL